MAYMVVLWLDRPREEPRPLLYLPRDGVLRKLWHGTVKFLPYRTSWIRAHIEGRTTRTWDETDAES